jgi:hypothetical protein
MFADIIIWLQICNLVQDKLDFCLFWRVTFYITYN